MKSVIVGTAGHIDHGKTALVKALTGIDADRLAEEKRRGITIDLGFAHLDLPIPDGPLRLGFVDVPGHERFVRNMLAGVGGIDLVLLVIAADESIKPQTREHFDILRLLGVRRGTTVLTKSDLVDAETLGVVKMEVREFLRNSFLDGAPILAVSSLTGAGLDELRKGLADVAGDIGPRDPNALARLPIDRVFTMKGFGTVVTGTLVSGTIQKEDELEVFPAGRRVRVRGVQVHGQTSEQATAGQRTALNLTGVNKEDLARGMQIAPPDVFRTTRRTDVSLSLLPSAKALRHRSRVHLHAHTSETVAEIVLYGEKQLTPGQTAFAQLGLADSALLLPGDRFIVRQFSPVVTIGGGVVLDAAPLQKVAKSSHAAFLQTLDGGAPEEILLARIARRGQRGLSFAETVSETGWRRQAIESYLSGLLQRGEVVRTGELLVQGAAIAQIAALLAESVAEFHRRNPLVSGIGKEALREKADLSPEVFNLALDGLVRDRKLEVAGEQVRLPGHGVVLKDEEADSKKIIETAFAAAGLKVPALKNVLAGLRVDKVRAQKIVTLLLRDKVLVKISEDLVFHRSALDGLRARMLAEKAKSPSIDVARFKDLTGVSRKYAIPLLEYLDRERVTKRIGDARVIL